MILSRYIYKEQQMDYLIGTHLIAAIFGGAFTYMVLKMMGKF